ncbi:hypothetical protein BYZ73_20730 [Rhodovulum viride]|uniref:Uncharacterized protein n=2 Tax=Rhodovulum viride TaxID=1231134 RepID=A0ABX9DBC3_9RHOB|nr:hypothetical protein BYZ73_20730 [Rhodovulum viride]
MVSDLRSALDHALYDAVMMTGGKAGSGIQFPTAKSRVGLDAEIKRKCRMAHPALTDFCRSLEPYEDGRGYRLWAVSRLAAYAKHRRILPLVPRISKIVVRTDYEVRITLPQQRPDENNEVEIFRCKAYIDDKVGTAHGISVDPSAFRFGDQRSASVQDLIQEVEGAVAGIQTVAQGISRLKK